jgi:inner membrane protein
MDYLNSYGIHPFHPFYSGWLYGDMVFIIEPVFWVVFGVPMAMMVRQPAFRIALLTLLAGALVYFSIRDFLLWQSTAFLLALAAGIGVFQQFDGEHRKRSLITAFGLGIGFVGLQGYASMQANRALDQALRAKDSASRILDTAMSSFPTNPLCWSFVSVESNEAAGSYRLRRGILSLAPDILPVGACPVSLSDRTLQPGATTAIGFQSAYLGSLGMLRNMKDENCHFAAWMRFARAPWIEASFASDIRFGVDSKRNFTTMRFAEFSTRECPRLVPGWDFPRADLLNRER